LNPQFYETVEIGYEFQSESPPPIILDVYDRDKSPLDVDDGQQKVHASDDFMCRAIIDLKDASIADFRKIKDRKILNTPPRPKWHDLRAGNNKSLPKCGKILVSFCLADVETGF